LLLIGLLDGEPLQDDPLVEYATGRFNGDLYVLRRPYDGQPIPLGVHAWEGVAVSQQSLRIVYSTTNVPFWQSKANGDVDVIQTAVRYFNEPSDLVTAVIAYDDDGVPHLTESRTVLTKADVGPVFLEPQDFIGVDESELIASAYGPVGNGADLLRVAMDGSGFERVSVPGGEYYEEWEGYDPVSHRAFAEVDWDAQLFPTGADLLLYDFDDESFTVFASLGSGPMQVISGSQNPVFSTDGKWVLTNTAGFGELPGYGTGILLFDVDAMPPLPAP
jgi:hypothetical protein